jgi:hypothetical protein
MTATADDGWMLVSDANERHLPTTGIVHHIDGCGVNNGRNRLRPGTSEELRGAHHCARCEARLARGTLPARPVVGTKVEVRLPDEVLSRVDALATRREESRAAVLRGLVIAGLEMT